MRKNSLTSFYICDVYCLSNLSNNFLFYESMWFKEIDNNG